MGLIELLIFIILVCVIAFIGLWVLGQVAPGHPVIIDSLIWVVAVLIILYVLAGAVGLHDVRIPRVFGFVSQSYSTTPVSSQLSSYDSA